MTNTTPYESDRGLPVPPSSRSARPAPPSMPSTPGLSSFSTIPSAASSPYQDNAGLSTSRRHGLTTPVRPVTASRIVFPPGSTTSTLAKQAPYDVSTSAFHSLNGSRAPSPMRSEEGRGGAGAGPQQGGSDLLTVHFGVRIVLRRPDGRTLSAHSVEGQQHYVLGLEGKALGDPLETFTLHSMTKRDDKGPVSYNSVVALRCPWAKEKCLALQSSGQVGLFRSLTGSSEKWSLQRPEAFHSGRTTPSSLPSNDRLGGKRGGVVQVGEQVVLVAQCGDVLVVEDGQLTAVQPDTAMLCMATFEVCFAGTPPYPSWRLSRMYLSGDFLLRPDRHRPSATQDELYGLLSTAAHRLHNKVEPLCSFPKDVQEALLVEDLLGAISGYEGRYIRVEASTATQGASLPPSSLQDVAFGLDVDSVDRSLASATQKFFPLCARVVRIRKFVDTKRRPDYGMVAQALASAVHSVLKEYMVQVAQLELKFRQQALSLTKMWFFLQPSIRTLEILDNLCTKVQGAKGGALLNLVRANESREGDVKSAKLHAYLLQRASEPYMVMLENWIYRGRLDDPYHEFMVTQEQSLHKEVVEQDFNAAYWDARYTISREHVFVALSEVADQVLTTGKYLNVFRECGQDVPPPPSLPQPSSSPSSSQPPGPPRLRYSSSADSRGLLTQAIEAAYEWGCTLLLDLLRQNHLSQCLHAIKHYFLLYKGDFFVHFMNVAEDMLLQDVSKVVPSRLEGLLHVSIQMCNPSPSSPTPHASTQGLSCTFSKLTLLNHLTAIHHSDQRGSGLSFAPGSVGKTPSTSNHRQDPLDSDQLFGLPTLQGDEGGLRAYETFMLDYRVRWPVSLVMSRRAVTKYQLLFRHLFLTKYVEKRLHSTWADQQATKELDVRGAMGRAFCLRYRMQHFIGNYVYFMMFEVVEPAWQVMFRGMHTDTVKNVDDVIRMHQDFQDTCMKECLLTNQPLLRLLHRILYLCMRFSSYVAHLVKDLQADDDEDMRGTKRTGSKGREARRIRIAAQTEVILQQVTSPSFVSTIESFTQKFDQHLGDFMRRLYEDSRAQLNHSHLANLCTRLDYNGYLSRTYGLKVDD